MDWQSKNIAIIGVGRTGQACAEVLLERGLPVRVYERARYEEKQSAVDALRARGIPIQTGQDVPDDWQDLSLVVVSPGVRPEHPIFAEAERHGVPVWSEIELAYRIARAPIVAVTGTNGKSTTTALIYHMLTCAGQRAWLCGNIAGGVEMPLIMVAHRAREGEVLVAEVSSFQLERVVTFRPKVAVLTNLQVDHLDYHKTWENYACAKGNLFRAQREEDWAVVNAEDEGITRLLQMLQAEDSHGLNVLERAGHILWFSGEPTVGSRQWAVGSWGEGSPRLRVQIEGRDDEIEVPPNPYLRGRHNLENMLAAAGAALLLGANPLAIQEALRTFVGLPHRMEFVAEINGVVYINNSMCTNATAFERSLQAVDRPRIAIVGGIEKSGEVSRLADAILRYCRYVLLIGASAEGIETALRARGFTRYECVNTLDNAVRRAQAVAVAGDVVILVPGCSSQDQFRNFEERGNMFKRLVQESTGEREGVGEWGKGI